jgi:hypothetical protein
VCRRDNPGIGASSVLVSIYGFLYLTGDLGRREPWCELRLLREEATLPSEAWERFCCVSGGRDLSSSRVLEA